MERGLHQLLDDAVDRLEENERALRDGPGDEEAHLRSYAVLEHALAAAGYARALGAPDDEVREYLRRAADAGARLFHLDAPVHELEDLDSDETRLFVDTSALNPWTFVQAAYAAVASGNRPAQEALGRLGREDMTSDYVEVLPVVERYAVALGDVLGGRTDAARTRLADDESGGGDADERFWEAQTEALRRIADGDDDRFRDAMGEVVAAFEAVYAGEDRREDPERLLALPVLGLEALARR